MIHARGLARVFDTKRGREKVAVTAVGGVDIDVDEGEIVGFLGPNGAGKTTTLRMLTTLLKPTRGTATVAGFDLATDPLNVRRNIGYVSQSGSTAMTARAEKAFGDIMDLAVGLGGTITGEHGVGRLKKPWLAGQLGPEAMELNRRIKTALDPDGILNPGAVI
jgi:ABC-type antimicrobial peptide transport system ATPase subunit